MVAFQQLMMCQPQKFTEAGQGYKRMAGSFGQVTSMFQKANQVIQLAQNWQGAAQQIALQRATTLASGTSTSSSETGQAGTVLTTLGTALTAAQTQLKAAVAEAQAGQLIVTPTGQTIIPPWAYSYPANITVLPAMQALKAAVDVQINAAVLQANAADMAAAGALAKLAVGGLITAFGSGGASTTGTGTTATTDQTVTGTAVPTATATPEGSTTTVTGTGTTTPGMTATDVGTSGDTATTDTAGMRGTIDPITSTVADPTAGGVTDPSKAAVTDTEGMRGTIDPLTSTAPAAAAGAVTGTIGARAATSSDITAASDQAATTTGTDTTTTATAADPAVTAALRQYANGARGTGVTALQQRLTELGYDTQGTDGSWGPNTQAAVTRYLADHPDAAPPQLNPQVVQSIMQSEGTGGEQGGRQELYGFRQGNGPAYAAILAARNQYGVGSPEETAVVTQYMTQNARNAGALNFTDPGVQAAVVSAAHMRGTGGAQAILNSVAGAPIQTSGTLTQDTIDRINGMTPQQFQQAFRDTRLQYDQQVYGNTTTTQGGVRDTWWHRYGNGLTDRYDREQQQFLNMAPQQPAPAQ